MVIGLVIFKEKEDLVMSKKDTVDYSIRNSDEFKNQDSYMASILKTYENLQHQYIFGNKPNIKRRYGNLYEIENLISVFEKSQGG